jgi:hypothetical protein
MDDLLIAMQRLVPGLLIVVSVSTATMIGMAQGRSIDLPTPWGPLTIGGTTDQRPAGEGAVLIARAQPYEGLRAGFAAVCKDSPLLEKTVHIGSPGAGAVVGVVVLHCLKDCSQEQANDNLILLHPEDIAKLFDDVKQPKLLVNASAVRAVPLSLI